MSIFRNHKHQGGARSGVQGPAGSGDTPGFDPTTLALSGYWRASFNGAPWTPTASAGSSGSNGNLDENTNPPVTGTPVNSLVPASFNGSTTRIFSDNDATSFYTVSTYSGWALVKANSASSNDTNPDEVNANDAVLSSGGGTTLWGVHLVSSGKAGAYHYDGMFTGVFVDFTIGQWNLIQWKYDGTDLKIRVNGGTRNTVAKGNMITLTRVFEVGFASSLSKFLDGDILELAAMQSAISDADEDNVLFYARSQYNLPLT